jgi:antitoxin component YwqK of YwqJK toxin-antitoxin module
MEVKTRLLYTGGKKEEHYLNGRRHNPNGPAVREWNATGVLICEEYFFNGQQHNSLGPAYRRWNEAGTLLSEVYWLNDRLHNAAGPAAFLYNDAGTLSEKYYYLRSHKLSEDDWRDQTKPPEITAIISRLHYPVAQAIIQHYCCA